MIVARTTGVQDIDWYSRRDYGRPARSAVVGMLPPKLAQILVNSTSVGVVADPFCGTGVVSQEALLLGREAVGSDLAPEMVAASRENLTWLAEQPEASTPLPAWQVEEADARQVRLPEGCAVVSEGYLGPNQSHSPAPAELAAMKHDLLALYKESLANWAKQLSSGAEVSLCVPAWRMAGKWHYLGLVDELPRLGYTLKGFKHVPTPLLYARENQVVGRQLLLLRKI
ncbi:MAG: putative methylase, partial [Patescibacteria group bacterium]|nr:putative methylase [Patescibacteria group bacterium]